jgi:RHS repeat-associated protein
MIKKMLKYLYIKARTCYGANVKYADKYSVLQQTIKDRYSDFEIPYNGNYVNCQYYYHSDHLGSTSLITNIEERNNKWNTPYLFNDKELDEETGLYYYGARYYDARVSLWLGADPMQEKYPYVSTYAYCVLNPVKLIDPDGKDVIPTAALKNNASFQKVMRKYISNQANV